ncbi:MAG: hypothetical protein ACK4J0_00605 [Candidatus Anstonellaceae archaeon]
MVSSNSKQRSSFSKRKLSAQEIDFIRSYYLTNPVSVRELAKIFGTSPTTIWRAIISK